VVNVEFFILPGQTEAAYLQFTVQQIKAYYETGRSVVVYADRELCQKLDQLLWFDQSDIFIPHFYITNETELEYARLPVVLVSEIGFLDTTEKDVMVDLSEDMSCHFKGGRALVKIVDQEPRKLNASRVLYKQLQHQGYQVNVHKIEPLPS
jgi:DNA polymerase IIIc chi subunit